MNNYWLNSPVYSGKQIVSGDLLIFSSNKSFLFKNNIIDVSTNHLELHIESNNLSDSIIRFISSSSASTRSYPVLRDLVILVKNITKKFVGNQYNVRLWVHIEKYNTYFYVKNFTSYMIIKIAQFHLKTGLTVSLKPHESVTGKIKKGLMKLLFLYIYKLSMLRQIVSWTYRKKCCNLSCHISRV